MQNSARRELRQATQGGPEKAEGATCRADSPRKHTGGTDRGLVICDDEGELDTPGEPDEQLVFIRRG